VQNAEQVLLMVEDELLEDVLVIQVEAVCLKSLSIQDTGLSKRQQGGLKRGVQK